MNLHDPDLLEQSVVALRGKGLQPQSILRHSVRYRTGHEVAWQILEQISRYAPRPKRSCQYIILNSRSIQPTFFRLFAGREGEESIMSTFLFTTSRRAL